MRIRLLIAYDGTDYAGWQRQAPNSDDPRPTIQATLEEALGKIFGQRVPVQASGRTDAGVHAEGQVIHFAMPLHPDGQPVKDLGKVKILRSLNALTPDSLSILRIWEAPADFHAIHSATQKTYRYMIHNSLTPNALNRRYSYWVQKPLSVDHLNAITAVLTGEHDFKSFQNAGTSVATTIRTITEAIWIQRTPTSIEFRVTGTGFLKQMVRNIVGTAVYLEKNGFGPEEMQRILKRCDRKVAKVPAPPQGLFLESVQYPSELDNKCREL